MAARLNLIQVLDLLLTDDERQNEVTLRRGRFLRYNLVATLTLSVVYVLCLYAIEYPVGVGVLTSYIVLQALFLAMLSRGVPTCIVGNAFCTMTVVGFIVLCATSNGISSATIVWFFATIVSGFWLIGRKAGYFWAAGCLLVVLALFASEGLGMRYPLRFPARYYYIYAGIAYSGVLCYLAVVLVTYENWQQSAIRLAERQAQQLQVQKTEMQSQRDALQQVLQELTTTQQQLIQKEKMASLGELTAGIAHEIQNPLNFVNNFAEVSVELLTELAEAMAHPTRDLPEEAELLTDLRQNLQKIGQHGQRAAGIVRAMLEHSRASSDARTATDLNALGEEYLRLAYLGARAQDSSFQAQLETDFAPALPAVEAVPGDLGRVLLNLLTNAFYAVRQRQRRGEAGYQPAVRVHTSFTPEQILVQVQDNGGGIPATVQAKIFQPFFTTKPTGEGTGLGLSLSYDIVTKGHGGTLAVDSQEGQGTVFTVALPRRGGPGEPHPLAPSPKERGD